jgi:hypothetical protein
LRCLVCRFVGWWGDIAGGGVGCVPSPKYHEINLIYNTPKPPPNDFVLR